MATGMTQSDYAKKIGCSRQYVSKLVKMGKVRFRNGKVYLDSVETQPGKTGETKVSVPRADKVEGGNGKGYWGVKTNLEQFNVLLKELDYHQRIGTLVITDEVQKVAFNAARKVRDLLNVMPERLCQVLAAESKPEKVKEILAKEIRQVEDELADGFSRRSVPPGVREGAAS